MTHQTADKFAAYIAEILDFGYHEYNGNLNDKNLAQLHSLFIEEGKKARKIQTHERAIIHHAFNSVGEKYFEPSEESLEHHVKEVKKLREWK